jgi:hypothetical protein
VAVADHIWSIEEIVGLQPGTRTVVGLLIVIAILVLILLAKDTELGRDRWPFSSR